MRVGAAYTQTGVLATGVLAKWMAKGPAVEIEELGRELGLTRTTQQANHALD